MKSDKFKKVLRFVPILCSVLAIFVTVIPPLAIILAIAGQVAGFYYRYNYEKDRLVAVGIGLCAVYIVSVLMFAVFYGMFVGVANSLMRAP